MRTPMYRRAVASDLDRWIADGLVEERHRSAILASLGGGGGAANTLAGFAAILLGFGAISFVAANWGALSDAMRLGILIAALAGSIFAAQRCLSKDLGGFGHGFALVAAALFGAGIMLTAQAFNIQAHYPTGTLLWALGAAAIAIVFASRPPLVLGAALGLLWLWQMHAGPLSVDVVWSFPLVWVGFALLAARLGSSVSAHLLALGAIGWLVTLAHTIDQATAFEPAIIVGALGLTTLAGALAAGRARLLGVFGAGAASMWWAFATVGIGFFLQFAVADDEVWRPPSGPEPLASLSILPFALVGGGLVLALGALLWRSTAKDVNSAAIGALAAVALGLAIGPFLPAVFGANLPAEIVLGVIFFAGAAGALAVGAAQERRSLIALGAIAFLAEAAYVYSRTFGGLLNTSLFFLVGGLALGGVALWLLKRERKTQVPGEAA